MKWKRPGEEKQVCYDDDRQEVNKKKKLKTHKKTKYM